MRPSLRSDDGAAAVEFALILPLLILLVFGIVEFGRAYNAKVTLTHAVREGARALAVGEDDPAQVVVDAASPLNLLTSQVDVGACDPGDPAEVEADFPFRYNIPLFGSATISLSAEAVVRCGG